MWQFLEEFKVIENLITKDEFSVLMRKISTAAGSALYFAEFLLIIEEVSKRIFKRDENLPSTYDKVEKFYQEILKLDDPTWFRSLFM
jgi:hypothetical protein